MAYWIFTSIEIYNILGPCPLKMEHVLNTYARPLRGRVWGRLFECHNLFTD